jgi:hypothetical protein
MTNGVTIRNVPSTCRTLTAGKTTFFWLPDGYPKPPGLAGTARSHLLPRGSGKTAGWNRQKKLPSAATRLTGFGFVAGGKTESPQPVCNSGGFRCGRCACLSWLPGIPIIARSIAINKNARRRYASGRHVSPLSARKVWGTPIPIKHSLTKTQTPARVCLPAGACVASPQELSNASPQSSPSFHDSEYKRPQGVPAGAVTSPSLTRRETHWVTLIYI